MSEACPYCEQRLPEDFQEKRRQKKSDSQRWAMQRRKERGLQMGRKRNADYSEIIELRKAGMTYREISRKLKVSNHTVQRAIKACEMGDL